MLIACAVASQIGIVTLVSTGYKILGYLNLPIIVLPAIILGGRKISKKYLKSGPAGDFLNRELDLTL